MKKIKISKLLNYFPTIVISAYLIIILALALKIGLPLSGIINDSFIKFGMNVIFVMSLIPMINAGVGLNFGMSIGISAGLLGICMALQFNLNGFKGIFASIVIALIFSLGLGFLHGVILNRLKGKEEIASIFIGYAFVPIMNIFWLLAPFTNRKMLYPVGGEGLRAKINLADNFGGIIDNLANAYIGDIVIPIGLIALCLIIGVVIQGIYKTKSGVEMIAVRENPKFAYISGIDIDKTRLKAIIISTGIAAIGIIIYSQSYGFVQLYDGTKIMAFPAISAILIGGATGGKANIWNALIGTYLYQMVFLLSVPVANALLIPELAEIMRMILSNGIILFAFLWKGEDE